MGKIEEIILRHSGRGMDILKDYLPEDYCRDAANLILEQERGVILLTTGFYVAGYAETDGPVGTVVLAKALEQLGFQPVIVTDGYCRGYFEMENLQVHYVEVGSSEKVFDDILEQYDPKLLISIERCGENVEGDYANMRGISIAGYTANIDLLFDKAMEKSIPTIGVGDGGNEIGMGNLAEVIAGKLSLVSCKTRVTKLVIATVSNWGAYGLAASLQLLTGKRVYAEYEFIADYLRRTVELGSIDGVDKKHVCTVDGFPETVEREIVGSLHHHAALEDALPA